MTYNVFSGTLNPAESKAGDCLCVRMYVCMCVCEYKSQLMMTNYYHCFMAIIQDSLH